MNCLFEKSSSFLEQGGEALESRKKKGDPAAWRQFSMDHLAPFSQLSAR
jgi:hypothetical protein